MYSPVAFHACVLVAGVQVPLRSEERFIRGIQATQKGGLLIFLFYIGFLLHILFDTRVEFQSGAWIPLRSTTTRCWSFHVATVRLLGLGCNDLYRIYGRTRLFTWFTLLSICIIRALNLASLRWGAVRITDRPATAWRGIHPHSAWIHSAVIVYPLYYCWNPLCPGLNRLCSCPKSLFFRLNSPLTTHIYYAGALNLQPHAEDAFRLCLRRPITGWLPSWRWEGSVARDACERMQKGPAGAPPGRRKCRWTIGGSTQSDSGEGRRLSRSIEDSEKCESGKA